MKKYLIIISLTFGFLSPLLAQRNSISSSSGFSGTGANMDVVYQRLNWNIDPRGARTIGGTVTTHFKTLAANVSKISFDLNSVYNNASLIITYHQFFYREQ